MKVDENYKQMLEFLYEGIYFVDKDRTITSWNKGAEKITGFSAKEVIGRKCYENILNHIDEEGNQLCFMGCPLHATMDDGANREARVFLRHKNGYRVPIAVKTMPLYDNNGQLEGAVEIFIDDKNKVQILNSLAEYKKAAAEDPLTEIPNRRYIRTVLEARFNESEKLEIPFGVAFLDIDDFKKVNDTYGHDVGDDILKMISQTLSGNLRKHDAVGRWGGEEFVVVFSDIDADEIQLAAEKIRVLVEKSKLRRDDGDIGVTVSIGATIAGKEDTVDTVINRADQLMYESKQTGKNRLTIG